MSGAGIPRLCIGGPMDGRWVDAGARAMFHVRMPAHVGFVLGAPLPGMMQLTAEPFCYMRLSLADGDETIATIWVPEGATAVWAVGELVKGYRQPAEDDG